MPRPKVPLQNRKRALQACSNCRSSKKRCNGQHPCTNCIRKGNAPSCVFEEVTPSSVASHPASSTQKTPVAVNELPTPRGSHGAVTHSARSGSYGQSPATTIGTLASSPEASHKIHPRLLDNSRGEKVFFGGSASLAFLQLIRETVSQSLGASDFSQYPQRDSMLEGPHVQAVPVIEVPLSLEQEKSFLDSFFVASHGLIELHTSEQILSVLNKARNEQSGLKPFELAVAQTTLAIGAQCSTRNDVNLTASQSYFAEAQRQAFAGMIEDPCLEMVQLFLLMSFYMLGACHRNAAFMYLGVAARAAYALGLHYTNHANSLVTGDSRHKSRMTWKSLVIMDVITSSLLGRPSATSTQLSKLQDGMSDRGETTQQDSAAIRANYQLACLLDQKVQELYHSDKVTAEGARSCLDELTAWSNQLPPELRLASEAVQGIRAQEQVIGGLRVSCFYYFAVMLVSRPFLIVYLTNKLARSRTHPDGQVLDLSEAQMEAEVSEIAKACLNAATYTIQTCIETQNHNLLPDNMRILKAWVFAAGLALGFEMFTNNRPEPDITDAFYGSRSIQKKLSVHSPQAAHYFDILTSLSEAVAARRRQALTERKRAEKPIVKRIMAFQPTQFSHTENEASRTVDPQASENIPATNVEDLNEEWLSGITSEFDFQDMMNDPFLNWDNADFLSWDPFLRVLPS